MKDSSLARRAEAQRHRDLARLGRRRRPAGARIALQLVMQRASAGIAVGDGLAAQPVEQVGAPLRPGCGSAAPSRRGGGSRAAR